MAESKTETKTFPAFAELTAAEQALQKGNLQKAELLARMVADHVPEHPQAYTILGRVASQVGSFDLAARYFGVAQQAGGETIELRQAQQQALQDAIAQKRQQQSVVAKTRYLLIKAWGYGFWSDLDHVAGQLLLADLTGRVPLVHWGDNSLFRGPSLHNDTGNATDSAFESFFEPVSTATLADVSRDGLSYFPAKWTAQNIRAVDVNKFTGPGSRISSLYALNRDEDVVVSDFHSKVNDLLPWIAEGSEYFGLTRDQVYRRVFEKYIRLKPHLQAQVEKVWQERLAGRNWLAVHVRGSDKVHEMGNLAQVNQAYYACIDDILKVNPSLYIFLLTDSTPVVDEFRQRYGEKIVCLDCQRSDNATGVHYAGQTTGTELGEQVILDAYLAARCDFFLGNGGSNVSVGIRHLKTWRQGMFFLIGADFLGQRNLMLHEW